MVGVGKVNSCRARLVELLTLAGDGVRQADDVHDLGAAETGDLHSSQDLEVRGCGGAGGRGHTMLTAGDRTPGGTIPNG